MIEYNYHAGYVSSLRLTSPHRTAPHLTLHHQHLISSHLISCHLIFSSDLMSSDLLISSHLISCPLISSSLHQHTNSALPLPLLPFLSISEIDPDNSTVLASAAHFLGANGPDRNEALDLFARTYIEPYALVLFV